MTNRIIFLLLLSLIIAPYADAQSSSSTKRTYSYLFVDEIPKFKGGGDSLRRFLSQKLKWPNTGGDIEGTVLVSFVVSSSGKIRDVKIEKSLYPEFDEEAKRLVALMPIWIPGRKAMINVDVKMYLPVDFIVNR